MGFLDKAKGNKRRRCPPKRRKGMSQGQAKLSEAQANKKAAGLFEQLGAWQWAQQQGRDGGQAQEQTAGILSELSAHEAEHGPIGAPLPPAAEVAPPPPGAEGVAPTPTRTGACATSCTCPAGRRPACSGAAGHAAAGRRAACRTRGRLHPGRRGASLRNEYRSHPVRRRARSTPGR